MDSYVEAQEYARSVAARNVVIQGRPAFQPISGAAAMPMQSQTEPIRPAL